MFIREVLTKNKVTGATYKVHRLIESYRTENGPRQRIILHLGTLDLDKLQLKILAKILEARLLGQSTLFEQDEKLARLADQTFANIEFKRVVEKEEFKEAKTNFEMIDLNSFGLSKTRSTGREIVGYGISRKLGFREILDKVGFSGKEAVLAETVVLARLIHPGSERETISWLKNHSTLVELLFPKGRKPGRNSVYEIADRLLEKKDMIERGLRDRELGLFSHQAKVFLYDLTNTYFEGRSLKNTLAHHGHSKEKRYDCPLVTLALMVDNLGFPVFSQIYRGNQGEPETLAHALDRLEKDLQAIGTQDFRPTLVMDRGIATKGNLKLLKERGFPFTVIERKKIGKEKISHFKEMEGFQEFKIQGGKIQLKKLESEETASVLVKSDGKRKKEKSIRSLKEKRFLEDVASLKKSVEKKSIFLPDRVMKRIGRISERHPSMGQFYHLEVEKDETGKAVTAIHLNEKQKPEVKENNLGCYVIETTHKDLSAREIWDQYKTLNQVEDAFRHLKSDLGFRPVHHQLARRTEGHLFISVLAYHFLVTIETMLEGQGDTRSWSTLKSVLKTVHRGTINCTNSQNRGHQIRVTEALSPEVKEIFKNLGIQSPFRRRHTELQVRL